MNGIAYSLARNSFFVTGKLWPKIYEIRFQILSLSINDQLGYQCTAPFIEKEVEGVVSQNAIPSKQYLGGALLYSFTNIL